MEFMDPVSKFMSTDLITVRAEDRMMAVKEVFDKHRIHHIPVVQDGYLVGIVSKSDYLLFLRGKNKNEYEKLIQISQLNNTLVEDVMIMEIAALESVDHINIALEIFSKNLFHSIPVVDNGKLVGILTTLDIIKAIVVENHLRIKPRKVSDWDDEGDRGIRKLLS